ncbi:hypothetical protein RBSWK_01035 [Rhodopirellula baltica SWK14]|uniref:Uncharacterized protein n=1 Tax=Rhodopirellula baltica SWK14 TaxID=993516 RepID=L7CMI8_RHOBT|nr:hypothetical protein RBSWK_01035 [Rhodopirellula baltica SWK14]
MLFGVFVVGSVTNQFRTIENAKRKQLQGSNSPQHAEKKSGLARLSRPAKHCGEIEGDRSVKEFMRRLMIPIPFDRSSAAAEVLRFRSHV